MKTTTANNAERKVPLPALLAIVKHVANNKKTKFKMKKLILIIIISLSLFGCDAFKSNDQLLTQHDWELAMKQVLVDSKMINYSKFSEPLLDKTIYLNFNENGILNIMTDEINLTYNWKWSDKEKNLISILGDDDFKGLYEIGDNISSDFLFLSKQKENINDNMVMLSFIPKERN